MKKANKVLLAAGLALVPFSYVLANTWAPPENTSGAPSNFEAVIMNGINWILGFITVIAVLFIIYGGIQYITASGDENTMKSAKKTITTAIIGLIVAGLAFAIVTLVTSDIITEGGSGNGGGNTNSNYVM
jgi:amino acid transporter